MEGNCAVWFKVDDKLPSNRKTRKVLRSHPEKRRDSAALGLWVLCGAWAGQNEAEAGWVPEAELDRFDDGWEQLAARLVDADFWWPEVLNGEPGFAFVNWAEYKPSQGASDDGRRGNHTRWHVARGVVSESCEFCPKDPGTLPDQPPENTDHRGDDRPDIAPESGTESGSIANPTRPDPTRGVQGVKRRTPGHSPPSNPKRPPRRTTPKEGHGSSTDSCQPAHPGT